MRLNFKVDYPEKLRRFLDHPTPYINDTMRAADRLVLILLQESIKTNAPRKTGTLAKSIEINVSQRKVFTNLFYARAIELGHYWPSKNYSGTTKLLHFIGMDKEGHLDVFLKAIRIKKRPFFFRSISQNKLQILEIYDDAFKKLMERV